MKFVFLLSVLLFAGCAQINLPTQSPEASQKRIAEAATQTVIAALEQKPAWLFTGEACPANVMPETETEIKYLAAGCADNPEECLKKCEQGEANACYSLAVLLEEKHGLRTVDTPPLYLRACRLGIVSGCTNYAASRTNFDSMDQATTACVANSFEKTCAKNDAWGCNMYGQILYLGLGREQNTEKALAAFRKACAATDADDAACVEAQELEKLTLSGNANSSVNSNKPE